MAGAPVRVGILLPTVIAARQGCYAGSVEGRREWLAGFLEAGARADPGSVYAGPGFRPRCGGGAR